VGIVPKLDQADIDSAAADPRSAFSEAYRSLRTGLQYASAAGAPKILLVTSALPSEGKTTTALMLATKFAQLGQRVLIIDADMRKPSLHSRMGLANEAGLSDFLVGQADGPQIFQSTGHENLTALTAGTHTPNPAELLAAPRFHSLLTVAGHSYDHVILDAPPMLGLADVPIMANAADGTLFVIEGGKARLGVVRAAVKRLHAVRAQITGAVLVKYDVRTAGYGYGYGYTSYYYDYSDAKAARSIARG
jgi:polysaccharide biosynthesis transport protein